MATEIDNDGTIYTVPPALSEAGRLMGRAGIGASKRRATTWTPEQAREAAKRPRRRRRMDSTQRGGQDE
jgi:hypothetical protein